MTTSLIRKTKANYYKKKIESNKNVSKNLWETVKEICSQGNKSTNITTINSDRGEIINDMKLITNTFNNEYISMGGKLANKIKKNDNYKEKKVINMNSIFLATTDSLEVKETISSLKNGKAAGIDGLKAETLKAISSIISAPFACIINKCIETGCFPSVFKKSIVLPIYKSGDRMKVSNYRPISLITNLTKIFEKIIKKRLCKYLEKFNILSERQYGFREGKSTQDAILHLTSEMYKALDESKPALCIFIDLSKAFDTVSHTLLMNTLENIGIRNTALDLFKSYITNRRQCVKIKDTCSNFKYVECGVPQGTVLGPILFNIYLNGLFSVQSCGSIVTYADDTAIFYTGDTWNSLKTKVEIDIKNIKDWLDDKLLTLNAAKTFYLPLSCNKTTLPDFDHLNVNNEFFIMPTEEVKYLGIMIDRHLKWDVHIHYIVKRLQTLIYKFKKLKEIIHDIKYLKTLYYALVESHISYGILGWGGVGKTLLNKLTIVQKRIIKIILNKEITYPTDLLYNDAGLLDPRQLFFVHCNIRQHQDKSSLKRNEHNYDTRRKNESYLPPFMYKSLGQKSFYFLGPKLYSHLPVAIKNAKHVYAFKKQIKIYTLTVPRLKIHDLI